MCQFKSAIILKDRVFCPVYDHHTQMLEELKIEDTQRNAETKFVRAELVPKNNDIFSDIDTWIFVIDQDIVPNWFVKEYEETRMKEAVKIWAKNHIFIGIDNLELKNGTFYLKDCKNTRLHSSTSKHYGSSTSEHYGSSTSKHYGSSTSEHYDSSTSKHYGSSTSKHYDSSTSEHYDSSTSEQNGNSVAIITKYSDCKKDSIVLMENSTLKDCKNKVIYQSGDYKLISVNNDK